MTSTNMQSNVPDTPNEAYALNKMASANKELEDTHELVN